MLSNAIFHITMKSYISSIIFIQFYLQQSHTSQKCVFFLIIHLISFIWVINQVLIQCCSFKKKVGQIKVSIYEHCFSHFVFVSRSHMISTSSMEPVTGLKLLHNSIKCRIYCWQRWQKKPPIITKLKFFLMSTFLYLDQQHQIKVLTGMWSGTLGTPGYLGTRWTWWGWQDYPWRCRTGLCCCQSLCWEVWWGSLCPGRSPPPGPWPGTCASVRWRPGGRSRWPSTGGPLRSRCLFRRRRL